MRDNLEDKFGTIVIKKQMIIGETIYVQGVDGYVITVMPDAGITGHRIRISQEKGSSLDFGGIKGLTKMLAGAATDGILDFDGTKDNNALMRTLGEELEKLVEKK